MDELVAYLNDPSDALCNMRLARWYETQGHLSPACGFYLRAAEFSRDKEVSYECMLRLYYCFMSLGNRDHTCETMLKSALFVSPRAPEAYFLLSQLYERKGNWMDSYLFASLGLEVSDRAPSRLSFGSSYEGEYMLVFQKAVSAWWHGKPAESRSLLRTLKESYRPVMNDAYLKLVQDNLSRLGSGGEEESCVRYDRGRHDSFKFKFPGLDGIARNYSQVCQDLFVLSALNGKRDGTYLEIGAAHPYHNSNTALLEELGWKGFGVELKKELADQHSVRGNRVICADALAMDYDSILAGLGEVVDYLQLDIEPPKNTFEAMLAIPFEKHKFRVITYEHDHYADLSGTYREKSRRFLSNLGYKLVVNDVSPNDNCSFEDWWVMEDLVDMDMVKKIKEATQPINNMRKFMFIEDM
jgi:hypothetical protein